MKLWTQQASIILRMLKDRKVWRVLDNYGEAKWIETPGKDGRIERTFDRVKSKTVDMIHKRTRRRWTFSRADFNRAKAALKGY